MKYENFEEAKEIVEKIDGLQAIHNRLLQNNLSVSIKNEKGSMIETLYTEINDESSIRDVHYAAIAEKCINALIADIQNEINDLITKLSNL